jgi:hypothetical protein
MRPNTEQPVHPTASNIQCPTSSVELKLFTNKTKPNSNAAVGQSSSLTIYQTILPSRPTLEPPVKMERA